MPYYQPEDVQRSRELLKDLLRHAPGAILIGGWGTWVRLEGEMSHDIGLIIDHAELSTLQSFMDHGIDRNHRLGNKRTADYRGVHVDLYATHEAILGHHLQLRAEAFADHVEQLRGFRVLTPEAHILTKKAALVDRPDTWKGQKDRYEIISLYQRGADPAQVRCIAHHASGASNVDGLIDEAFEFLSEYEPLRERATWGKKDKAWLNNLRKRSHNGTSGGSP